MKRAGLRSEPCAGTVDHSRPCLLPLQTATEAAQRMKREAEEQAEKAAKAAAEAQTVCGKF